MMSSGKSEVECESARSGEKERIKLECSRPNIWDERYVCGGTLAG